MNFLTLILTPYITIWLVTKRRLNAYRWLALLTVLFVQILSVLPAGAIVFAVYSEQRNETPDISMATGQIYTSHRVSNSRLHGLRGFEGVDIVGGCGASIYAPFSGVVTYQGLDGYRHFENGRLYPENTMLTIKGDNGMTLTLLHGNYTVQEGAQVTAGQVVGTEASKGWSTGCHSHVILKDANGRTLNYLNWQSVNTGNKPLRISWYDPERGGINCDSDCTTMSTGVKVTPDRYGRTAACIREWTGRTVYIPSLGTFECLDRGGAIVEHADYIWIDLLLHEPLVPFGTLVYEYEVR